MSNIELVDSNEFHKPVPKSKETQKTNSTLKDIFQKYAFTRYPIYAIIWFLLLRVAYVHNMGHAYVCITGLVLILTNLGTRKKGELSAYSIFNKDGKRLLGTMDTNQLDPRMRHARGDEVGGNIVGMYDEDGEEFDEEPNLQNTKINKISKMNNQPCYCGSGKKFKKCCYWRELKQRQMPVTNSRPE